MDMCLWDGNIKMVVKETSFVFRLNYIYNTEQSEVFGNVNVDIS